MNSRPIQTYRIGELAKRANKTVRTIHFYEELGLLQPADRSPGGFRLYNDYALDRIHWIERLQVLGFSLSDIKQFLADCKSHETGPQSMGALRKFYDEKLKETQEAITRLKSLETELKASIEYLQACTQCTSTSALNACINCSDQSHSTDETPRLVSTIARTA